MPHALALLDCVAERLAELDDLRRQTVNRRHGLLDILAIALRAVVYG